MEFRDLKAQYLALQEKIDANIKEVLLGGSLFSGVKWESLKKNWLNLLAWSIVFLVLTEQMPYF